MKHLNLSLALPALIILGLSVSAAAAAAPKSCTNVRGVATFHATGPDSFFSTLTGDLPGSLIGTNFKITKVGDDGTIHFVVDHEFVTARGTFFTVAVGILSPVAPGIFRTSERNFFRAGGTGDFAGADGTLLIQTLADFTGGGEGSGEYHGRICARA